MKTVMKYLVRLLGVAVIAVAAVWVFGVREPVVLNVAFDATQIGPDVDAYLERREGVFDDIKDGTKKRVVWAGAANEKTPVSVVYIHGFSASSEEIRPVPDRVAAELGANLVFTRLAGHGRTGEAMATASVEDWMTDVAEAMAIARQVGEEVLVMSTSTGGTLSAAVALNPELSAQVKGYVFVSPNFGVNMPGDFILTWPAARTWLPIVAGKDRSFEPRNEQQGKYWSTAYPTVAVLPMAALVKEVVAQDFSKVQAPAIFIYSQADRVVRPEMTQAFAAKWGGPVTTQIVELREGVDEFGHVLTGDIVSPAETPITIKTVVDWFRAL